MSDRRLPYSEKALAQLHHFLTAHPGDETLLIVPGQWAGRQLLALYARAYGGILGLRIHTPDSLAREVCALSGGAPALLGENAAAALILSLLREDPPDFFKGLGDSCFTLSTARELLRCFHRRREADGTSFGPGEVPRLAALEQLYCAYKEEKASRNLLDRDDLFAAALERLDGRPLDIPAAICSNVSAGEMARAFLKQAVQGAQVLSVPTAEEAAASPELFLPQEIAPIPGQLRFVQGYGDYNETLFPFYDLLDREIPFGQAAILYASPSCLPLLQSHAARLGVPLTLAEGVPLKSSLLLSVLRDLEAWYQGNCPVNGLAQLVESGLRPPHAGKLLRLLRRSGVILGLDAYDRCIQEYRQAADREAPDPAQEPDSWIPCFQAIRLLFHPDTGAQEGLSALRGFLIDYYVKPSPQPALRAAELSALIAQGEGLLTGWRDGSFSSFLPLTLDCAGQTSWLSASPRDGAVHATPLSKGVFLARPYVYILGLNQGSLTRSDLESPLLREEECAALGLDGWAGGGPEPVDQLRFVLADAGGELTLSYSSLDEERVLSLPPAPIYERLRAGQPSILFDYHRPCALTDADRWLSQGIRPGHPAFSPTAEHLGEFMDTCRFSATSLETALDCPLRFYLQYVLKIPQPDQPAPETSWLQPNDLGTLVHQALEAYFSRLAAGETPDLAALWKDCLEHFRQEHPCPFPVLVERDSQTAWGMVSRAVGYFQTEQAGHVPLAAELTFGRPFNQQSDQQAAPFPLPEEFVLKLDGLSFHFTGSVDRLDRLPSGELAIMDYKTGS